MKRDAHPRTSVHRSRRRTLAAGLTLGVVWVLAAGALQAQAPVARPANPPAVAPAVAQALTPPPAAAGGAWADYVIGPTDVLSILVWGEKELSSDVVVRPDGKISLPLLNDVVAAGLTPEQLRAQLTDRVKRFVKDPPVVTVVVKQVNNNQAFITGKVARPGPYVLSANTTVLQLLALAGGFSEFADSEHILISRIENGVQRSFTFNYNRALKRQDLSQNIILKAGDTVVVP